MLGKRVGTRIPRVALLVDTSTSWGRRIVMGVNQYMQRKGPWHLFIEARGPDEMLHVRNPWKGDGVIARVAHASMARELSAWGIPVVNVSRIQLPGVEFPRVSTDLKAAARMAATHLIERGFQHFAYFSLLRLSYVTDLERNFAEVLKEKGYRCAKFNGKRTHVPKANWTLDMTRLAEWLESLPKPVGIFTWNASSGRQIIHGCQWAGLKVPEQVAVLSGADDDLLCEISNIPMSGLSVAEEQIGWEAGAMLDRLMQHRRLAACSVQLKPMGVVTRQSTNTLAIADADVASAVRYIRGHPSVPIQVGDVVAQTTRSRRSLERHFKELLGRTISREIRSVHVEHAKQLLVKTNLSVPEVAKASGFSSAQYLIHLFNLEVGQTPLRYRKKMQTA